MKRAALYIRVSTSMQADEGLSIPAQLKLLKEYAVNNSYSISEEHIYIDAGESAKSADRPEFQKMIAAAKKKPHPFDAVLVHKTDRFARNRLDSAVYKSLLRKECGIDVISISEQFSDDPYGVMMEGIMEVFAEFYSLNLSAEVTKGMIEAADSGIVLGRIPFGYDVDPGTNKYIINEQEAEVIRAVFDMYVKQGYGMDKIHTYFNSKAALRRFGDVIKTQTSKAQKKISSMGKERELKWSSHAIRYILKNDTYIGVFRWNPANSDEVVIEDNHPAIIDKKIFEEAQRIIVTRRDRANGIEHEYMLRGMVRCAYCGRAMVIFSTKRKGHDTYYRYIRCSNKNQDALCRKNGSSYDLVEGLVIDELIGLGNASIKALGKLRVKTNQQSKSDKTIERIKNILEDFDSKFDRQMEAFEAGIISLEQLGKYKDKLEQEKSDLERDLMQAEIAADSEQVDWQEFKQRIISIADVIQSDEYSEYDKQRAISSVVDKITFDKFNKKLEIFYRYD